MAFHPFKHFRKHQKAYLAGLTILTMIIFVFSFGAADPFQRALHWIGLTSHHGERVIELYGKTIRTDDLEKLRWHRQMASEFLVFGSMMQPGMMGGMHLGTPLEKSYFDIQAKYGPKKGKNDLPTPMQNTLQQVDFALLLSNPRFSSSPETRLQPLQKQLREVQKQLSFPEAQNNPDHYRALDTLATILAFHAWAYDPERQPSDSYFGGSLRPEGLLDFLIWKHVADQLGIVLTQADVSREINRAWGYGDPDKGYLQPDGKFDANQWVALFFQANQQKIHKDLTTRDLLNALIDEYRVALAKEAVLGSSSGVRSYRQEVDGVHFSPSVATPDEFYRYFREQRTTLSVSTLPIAVKDFVSKVPVSPTETDLRNLYERYKNDEPSPTRRQPGFKEPRRIKLEYLSYRPDGPFARQLAAKATELLPVFRVGQPASTFAAGGGLAWAASIAGYADLDTVVRSLYEKYREEESRRRTVKYDRLDTDTFGLDRELQNQRGVDVQASTALVGQLLGGLGTAATLLAAPTSWLAAQEYHQRATLTAYAATVLAGASSSPLPAMTLPMRYLYTTQPFEAVRQQMVERFEKTLAKTLMDAKVLAFRKELDKVLANPPEQREPKLKEFLTKAPEYGLENFHAMKDTQTQQEMLDHPDPALKELQAAWETTPSKPFQDPTKNPDLTSFARDMFFPFDTARGQQDTPVRSAQFPTASGDVVWVLWKSEDRQAKVRPFEDVREEVKEAWYTEQARKLAREKAQQINAKLKKQNLAPDDAVKFLIQQDLGSVFTLNKVSQLMTPEFNLPGRKTTGDYRRYQPPREFIPYPPSDFVDQLLKLKKRGDSLVIADKPAKHFYVAVLMENPQPPERQEFYDVYGQPSLDNRDFMLPNQEEPMWSKMMADRQRKYALSVLEQLRTEATKELQDGEYVLPDNVRNRSESSSDTGE
jgi:hypothetical protein